jgi:hypothetical protein
MCKDRAELRYEIFEAMHLKLFPTIFMSDIIELRRGGTLGVEWTGVCVRAMVPFDARMPRDQAELINLPSFLEVDFASVNGLRWTAMTVVVHSSNGSWKLFLA